jgi:hypothetical protein
MRKLAVATVATAALCAAASTAVAYPGDHGRYYRGYYRADVDVDAIRAKCRTEYRVARDRHGTQWNRHEYVSRCVDRNIEGTLRNNARNSYYQYNGRYYRYDHHNGRYYSDRRW